MDTINRVRIEVNGARFVISSQKDEKYIKELGAQINSDVKELMDSGRNITFNEALTLSALNYLDAYKESERNADHLRGQINAYLEDAGRARIEADEAKREIARLRRELELARRAQGGPMGEKSHE
ncbi:cell division protein ZapA [Clostridiaceae bacterium NSJ-31]|uniref:Cell division protein ZapA n=1 Tax=Ligaoa zhengdingensis TaxID=2763658 RepID=A0A926E0E4_9FIRM|nr:cell division protein ZapA [Ligaoa zhengdingensis]MBC8546864.1 cell division protein ZapA [Ligaoa zhengdingensis]